MYIYQNKFYSGKSSGIYFFGGSTTTAYFYHNTIVTDRGFSFGSTKVNLGLPNLWVINNLFSCSRILSDSPRWTIKPHFDYNYCGGDLSDAPAWWGSHNKIVNNGQLWSPDSAPDFILKTDSPASAMGIDISKTWTLQGVANPPLIGFNPGYFSGARPDAGAK
jgi:hypothetical protein